MNPSEHTQFGQYEKRDKILDLYCTTAEYARWKKKHGRNLGKRIRQLLNRVTANKKRPVISSWPKRNQLTKHFAIKCSESELWYWKMMAPLAYKKGMKPRLKAFVRDLLNQHF